MIANGQQEDEFKNEEFFNITKFTYISLNSAELEEFREGQGLFRTDLDTDNSQVYSLKTIFGYFLSPHWSLGAGIGLDGYHNPNFNTAPLFIDIRGYFVDGKNTSFAFLDLGTLLKLSNEFEKGYMLETGVGYKFFASENIAMVFSINASFKGLSLTNQNYTESDRIVDLRGVGFTLGFIF
tara:strand:+ start:1744 stop:2286 length:543 start_codon:yes stop_codon:yes gene_type:complete